MARTTSTNCKSSKLIGNLKLKHNIFIQSEWINKKRKAEVMKLLLYVFLFIEFYN